MIEPQLVLCGAQDVLDGPAAALYAHQRLDCRPWRIPVVEVGKVAVGDIATDQQAARPQALLFIAELRGLGINPFEIGSVVQS